MTSPAAVAVVLVAALRLLWHGAARCRGSAPRLRGDLTGADGARPRLRLSSSTRGSMQAEAELQRACGAGAARSLRRARASTALWWRILLDPDSRALDEQFYGARRAGHPRRRKRGPRASRTTRRRTSMPAPPTPRACSGGCCATRSSPPRATASASSRRSSARIALDPEPGRRVLRHRPLPGTTRTSRRRRRRCSASCCCSPAATRRRAWRSMQRARARGHAPSGRSRLPAPHHLSVVRAARRPRRRPARLAAATGIPATRCSRPSSPTSRTATSTTSPASLATWRALLAAARTGSVNEAELAEAQARLGIARQLEACIRPTPPWSSCGRCWTRIRPGRRRDGRAYLALGEGEDRMGHHDAAVAAYRLAIATAR